MAEREYWLDLFTATTWREFLEAGATVSGFRDTRWQTLQQVKLGDYFLCYLTGAGRFIGILEVASAPFRDTKPIWKTEEFPCRVQVRVVAALTPETGVPVQDLRDELSIFEDPRPNAWTGHVRGSPARWTRSDGEAILRAVCAAKENPVAVPVPQRKLSRQPTPPRRVPEPETAAAATREGVPTFDALMKPTIAALQALGGSGTTEEIYQKVIELCRLPDDILTVMHGSTSQTEVEYRLAWTRTYLKNYGVLTNSARKVWTLSADADTLGRIDPREVRRVVQAGGRGAAAAQPPQPGEHDHVPPDATDEQAPWREDLLAAVVSLTPAGFERLAQRLLRESGFVQVDVTGRSGDGGIDGTGVARINGFLSFRVLFQCKRQKEAVTPSQMRDFRGAMQGRTDKGLFLTTGTFSQRAIEEATRDGVPPIDLIDGEALVERLKDLGLGVRVRMVEVVDVDHEWFGDL